MEAGAEEVSVPSSPPLHHDDHPDCSPVGSPESHLLADPSPPTDQLHVSAAPPLTGDLRNKIIKQVEYYFSDENLPSDKFLMKYVSKDKDGFVPVGVIASFRKMKKLTKDTSQIVAALRESSFLVVSGSGKKVRRRHPLPSTEAKDPKFSTVLVENLPQDHSIENLQRIFSEAGKVRNIGIREPQTVREQRNCTIAEKLLSGKLHAVVEYETVEAAEKAVSMLNNEQDWRFGLRVKLLMKMNKQGQTKKAWRETDSNRTNGGQSFEPVDEENHYSTDHHDDSHDEEDDEHAREKNGEHHQEKNGHRDRNRGHGRRQKRGNGQAHGGHSTYLVEPSKPPPGPKMPDGTRGFTMGRGRPLASTPT